MTGDGTRYILKDWFRDRECNIKDGFEIRQALSRLAMLHSQLKAVEFKEEWSMGSNLCAPLEEELERHNKEMQRTRNYIRGKRKKSDFELCVIGNYNMFYEQAQEAVHGIKGLWSEEYDQAFEYDALEDVYKRQDIGDVVACMVSDAFRYMTGATVLVDGGLMLRVC